MYDQEGGGSFVTSQRPAAVYHFKSTAASATARPTATLAGFLNPTRQHQQQY